MPPTRPLALRVTEVPTLYRNRIGVEVPNIDLARVQVLGRQLARIGTAAGLGDLIAAAKRQGESRVAAADGGRFGQPVVEPLHDRVLFLFSCEPARVKGDPKRRG